MSNHETELSLYQESNEQINLDQSSLKNLKHKSLKQRIIAGAGALAFGGMSTFGAMPKAEGQFSQPDPTRQILGYLDKSSLDQHCQKYNYAYASFLQAGNQYTGNRGWYCWPINGEVAPLNFNLVCPNLYPNYPSSKIRRSPSGKPACYSN